MNIFRIVSFIENVDIGLSRSVALNEKFFGVRNIMNRQLRNLEPGNELPVGIEGDGGFQELVSGFSRSSRNNMNWHRCRVPEFLS